jgi:hypothetical protein
MPLVLMGVEEAWQGIPPAPPPVIESTWEPLWVSGKGIGGANFSEFLAPQHLNYSIRY